MKNHQWEPHAPYCSCGQDTVTCQGCGKLVCGDVALRVSDPKDARMSRNVGPCCWARFGIGHAGPSQAQRPEGYEPEWVCPRCERRVYSEEHSCRPPKPVVRIDLVAILKKRLTEGRHQ